MVFDVAKLNHFTTLTQLEAAVSLPPFVAGLHLPHTAGMLEWHTQSHMHPSSPTRLLGMPSLGMTYNTISNRHTPSAVEEVKIPRRTEVYLPINLLTPASAFYATVREFYTYYTVLKFVEV